MRRDDDPMRRDISSTAGSAVRLAGHGVLGEGETLAGRWEIRRCLGVGGMGTVYEAFDRSTARSVALKTLQRDNPNSLYRFKAEFRGLADVVHPNLVRLYELICEDSLWFFTMELIHGVSFVAWLRPDRPFVPQATLPAGQSPSEPPLSRPLEGLDGQRLWDASRQLALGIDAIHRAGKLHRDLKPSNVLVERDGRVVVLDFGLLGDRDRDAAGDTVDQSGMGTPSYMSPEQCRGEGASIASDWYAFGVMLYRCLAGKLPFTGTIRDIFLDKQAHDPPPLPDSVAEALPELASLTMALTRRDPSSRPGVDEVLSSLGADRSLRLSTLPPAAGGFLVGRDHELDALAQLATGIRDAPGVAIVRGPSGIGKSALVAEACERLSRRGALCLRGRCYERESVPFKAFDSVVDALSHHLCALEPRELTALLPHDVAAMARLFPVMARVPGVGMLRPGNTSLNPEEVRRRGFEALATLLGGLAASRQVVVVLDDLQWADPDSLALLEALLGVDGPACMFVATLRDDASGEVVAALFEVLARASDQLSLRRLELGPLPPAEMKALVLEELGAAPEAIRLCAMVIDDAGGNPFLAKQLAAYLRRVTAHEDEPPSDRPSIASLIAERLRRLEPGLRTALELLALAGKPLSVHTLVSAAGLEGEEGIAALHADRWVRYEAATHLVEPVHDRIREEVASQLSATRDHELRRKLVDVLLVEARPDHEAIARHLGAVGDKERASRHAEQAADAACDKLAFAEGARLYELALLTDANDRERERDIQEKLGDTLARAGRGRDAARWLQRAARGRERTRAMRLRGRAAEQLLVSGHVDEGFDELREVLAALDIRAPARNAVAAAELAALRLMLRFRGTEVREREVGEVSAETLTTIDLCRAGAHTFAAIAPIVGAALQTRHVLLALDSGHAPSAALGLAAEAGFRAYEGGDAFEEARRFLRLSEQVGGATPSPRVEAYLAFVRGLIHHLRGEYADAVGELRYAENLFVSRCENVFGELNLTRTVLGVDLYLSGQLREMCRRFDAWLADARRRDDRLALTTQFAGGGAVNLWLVRDQPEEASAQTREAIRCWPSKRIHSDRYWHNFSLALVATYAGDDDALIEHAHTFWAPEFRMFVTRLQARRVWAMHLTVLADLAAMRGSAGSWSQRRAVRRRIEKLRSERYGFAEAVADTSEAWLLHLEGNDAEALRFLRRALRVHEVCNNQLYCHAIRMQMGRLLGGDEGAQLLREASAALAAEGAKNPEALARGSVPGFGPR